MRTTPKSGRTFTPQARMPRPKDPEPLGPIPSTASIERVRQRAFQIYQGRLTAGVPGDELSDWLQAEHECVCMDPEPRLASMRASLRGETLLKDPE